MDEHIPDVIGGLSADDAPAEEPSIAAALAQHLSRAAELAKALWASGELTYEPYQRIAGALDLAAAFVAATPPSSATLMMAELTAARAALATLDDVQQGRLPQSALRFAVHCYQATARAAEQWRQRATETAPESEPPGYFGPGRPPAGSGTSNGGR